MSRLAYPFEKLQVHLSFNTEQWPFDDLQVRRALSHAFNTEAMRRVAYLGEAVATYDFVPVDMQGYRPVMEESAKYDLALAKSMLAVLLSMST